MLSIDVQDIDQPQPVAYLAFRYLKAPKVSQPERKRPDWSSKHGNARRFAKNREKKRLRPILMGQDPHCCQCRKPLQDTDPQLPDYAIVILDPVCLYCPGCFQSSRDVKRDSRKNDA